MKISVCVTVFNEEKDVGRLLKALLTQTAKEDEIVIVDVKSKDKTVENIREYQKKHKNIKLLIKRSSTAEGRNLAVKIASNEIIAFTDAGCTPHKDWLKKLTKPFKDKKVGLVAGFYTMPAKTHLQAAVNVYHGVPPERFDENKFLPSTRSVAFKKSLWEKVGGFNENLERAGEDTEFFYKIVKTRTKIVRAKDALVDWNETASMLFSTSIKKFYNYAKGDAQTGIWWHPTQRIASHNIKIFSIFVRYLLGMVIFISALKFHLLFVLLVAAFLLYLMWSVWKWKDVVRDWSVRIWLPVVQVSSDFAVMCGFLAGILK